MVTKGLFADMSLDGFDHVPKIGTLFVRMRSCLDTLETTIYHTEEGEIL